jgi:hypothetical protein
VKGGPLVILTETLEPTRCGSSGRCKSVATFWRSFTDFDAFGKTAIDPTARMRKLDGFSTKPRPADKAACLPGSRRTFPWFPPRGCATKDGDSSGGVQGTP